MSWWSRLTGGKSSQPPKPQRLDYLSEGLALRDQPNDQRILQNMAIAYSKTARLDDAIRCYRRALELDPQLSGAHYGLAFLLLKRGDAVGAERHLTTFLAKPPSHTEAERWVRHARETLSRLRSESTDEDGGASEQDSAADAATVPRT